MSTSATVFYQFVGPGGKTGAIGVYLHGDGYPSHTQVALESMSYEQVRDMVEEAVRNRTYISYISSDGEYRLGSGTQETYHSWPIPARQALKYNYLKRVDGTVTRDTGWE